MGTIGADYPARRPPFLTAGGSRTIAAVSAEVVILKHTTGTDSERILDQLEQLIEVRGEPTDGGRRYWLQSAANWDAATASLSAKLNLTSDTWSIHVGFQRPG